jgi:UPF0755 protein
LKKALTIFLIGFFLFFIVLTGLYLNLTHYWEKPNKPISSGVIITIPPGESLQTTTKRLFDAGLISNPFKFKLLASLKGYDKKIKAGEYMLSASVSPKIILKMMVEGNVRLHKLTVPEGYNLRQIAFLVSQAGFTNENDFLKATADVSYLKEKGLDAETFEGYLFPDTYYFPRKVTPRMIITKMLQRFRSVFTSDWQERCRELGFSIHDAVTLASIIEKETGDPAERPVISSVFHNRLRKRMRLESDPTVIYRIQNFNGNLTRNHLTAKDPYNTYRIRGLPPGPIANPGFESLKAALYPAGTPYLYFVSKNDKTHHFSANITEHNRAVRKYQLRR